MVWVRLAAERLDLAGVHRAPIVLRGTVRALTSSGGPPAEDTFVFVEAAPQRRGRRIDPTITPTLVL